jgi:tetratricopeptide (TPR) repeat protein
LLAALVYQNCGICYRHMGRYEEALDAYTSAERCYRALGQTERAGDINNNRGNILLQLGRVSEALAAFETAATLRAEAGLTLLHAQSLGNIGEAHLLLGHYTRSLAAFEQAHRLLESLEARVDQQITLTAAADAYLALNLYTEALGAYREAERILRDAGMAHHRGWALWGMGSALIAQSRLEEAQRVLAEAAALFTAADNGPLLAGVMLEQAALLEARGDRAAALATARQVLTLVSGHDWPVQQIYAHMRTADLRLPETVAAESHLLEAQRLADPLRLPHLRYRLNQRLGHVRRLQGRDEEAETLLQAAVDEIERLRGHLAQEVVRASFLRDKVAAYEDLVQLYLDRGDERDVRRAFAVAEQAKSRALVDLLMGITDFPPPNPPQPSPAPNDGGGQGGEKPEASADLELGIRLQALQAELHAIYNQLLSGPGGLSPPVPPQLGVSPGQGGGWGGPPGARFSDLQARAVELEQTISRLRLRSTVSTGGSRIARTDPLGIPLSLETIQAQLPPDVLLLAYHVLGDEIMAFLSTRGRLCVVRRLSTGPALQRLLQRLAQQWDCFRAGRGFVNRHLTWLEQSAQRVLGALYTELVAPLESHLAEAVNSPPVPPQLGVSPGQGGGWGGRPLGEGDTLHRLAIVPHGWLHQVPFHALHDGQHYLLERFEIAYAPSATVLVLCQARASSGSNKALILGTTDPLIPAVATEVCHVAQYLPRPEVRIDEQATLGDLKAKASGCDILHLACHGLFRPDNPMFSALQLHDGWLTATDVMQLNLTGALVTLSACESGRSQVIAGDEILGLTRAFLGAGAASLIVSLWLVQDDTTARLMALLYEQLRDTPPCPPVPSWEAPEGWGAGGTGRGRAAALRAAQLALKAQYPHPYYWAPFVLIGQR